METVFQTLESKLASIDVAESAAFELATRAGFEGLSLDRIGLAVREITTNAIIHGNRHDPGKKVFVAISRTPTRLEVNISDQGAGFDPNAVSDPLDPEALLQPSGRGLYLARVFMDELHVRQGDLCGATVVLVKYVNGFARQDALDVQELLPVAAFGVRPGFNGEATTIGNFLAAPEVLRMTAAHKKKSRIISKTTSTARPSTKETGEGRNDKE